MTSANEGVGFQYHVSIGLLSVVISPFFLHMNGIHGGTKNSMHRELFDVI